MCLQIHPLSLEPFAEAQACDSQQGGMGHAHPRHGTAFTWAIWIFSPTWKDHCVIYYLNTPGQSTKGEWSVSGNIFLITGPEGICLYLNVKITVTWTWAVSNVECSLLNAEYFSLQGHFEAGKLWPSWTWGCFARRKRRGLRYQRPRTLSTVSTPHLTPSTVASWACRPNGKAW